MITPEAIKIEVRHTGNFNVEINGALIVRQRMLISDYLISSTRDRDSIIREGVNNVGGRIWNHVYGDMYRPIAKLVDVARYVGRDYPPYFEYDSIEKEGRELLAKLQPHRR